MENDPEAKSKVRIYVDRFMITCEIDMIGDASLADFMAGAPTFITVTGAVVQSLEDRMRFTAEFLNVQKDKIIMILPEALAKPDYAARRRWPL